jgi:hypothetical protein
MSVVRSVDEKVELAFRLSLVQNCSRVIHIHSRYLLFT